MFHDLNLDALTMAEIIRLQDQLSQTLKRRFEKLLALTFSDIVDSTPYFQRFGNEAGKAMHQRHTDMLSVEVAKVGGRIVDTAGDGAFACFPSVESAVSGVVSLQKAVSRDNASRPREHHLAVRIGLHFGPALTDGVQVTGESVNLAARVASSAKPGEIRLTTEAFREIPSAALRAQCRPLPPQELKGIVRPVQMLLLAWRSPALFPTMVIVVETGDQINLPDQDFLSFGRLKESDAGGAANDIVLAHPDPSVSQHISRWHFQLRRTPDGVLLRPVTDQLTEVDGQPVAKGQDVPVRAGTVVRVARVLSLRFQSPAESLGTATVAVS